MSTTTQTHDTKIFCAMVEILTSSILGKEEYGFNENNEQTTYGELAQVMNQMEYFNRSGQPLNRNALKQVVHRMRKKEDVFSEIKEDALSKLN